MAEPRSPLRSPRVNHWHLVIWPRQDGELSEFMRLLTVTRAQRWQANHHSAGTARCITTGSLTEWGTVASFGATRWYTAPVVDELTRVLQDAAAGNTSAMARVFPLVYEELRLLAARKLARERPGHTLQPTALVHEAYLRLAGAGRPGGWQGRAHFFGTAAEIMRRILIDNARRRAALCRGSGREQVSSDDALATIASRSIDESDTDPEDLVALDAALSKLEAEDKLRADLVKLHYFAGLSLDDAAETLGISRATAYRHWAYARAWLRHEVRARKS
jgi:RNA polymerase sigma factor (TIGR02999 family)